MALFLSALLCPPDGFFLRILLLFKATSTTPKPPFLPTDDIIKVALGCPQVRQLLHLSGSSKHWKSLTSTSMDNLSIPPPELLSSRIDMYETALRDLELPDGAEREACVTLIQCLLNHVRTTTTPPPSPRHTSSTPFTPAPAPAPATNASGGGTNLGGDVQPQCGICNEPLDGTAEALECSHTAHRLCLVRWFGGNHTRVVCWICRHSLPLDYLRDLRQEFQGAPVITVNDTTSTPTTTTATTTAPAPAPPNRAPPVMGDTAGVPPPVITAFKDMVMCLQDEAEVLNAREKFKEVNQALNEQKRDDGIRKLK